MDEREENVDERRAGEQAMGCAEEGAKPPAVAVDREEDGVVGEREHLSEDEVEEVAERLGAGAVGGKRGAEQERQVHPDSFSSFAARSAVVRTRVPAKPPARAPQMLTAR